VWKKVEEETAELKEAETLGVQEKVEEEFGDLLFSLINYARFLQVDPELALERTNRKFKSRFMQMEVMAKERNLSLENMSLQEMDALWNDIKKQ